MSETINKTEHPELKVSDDITTQPQTDEVSAAISAVNSTADTKVLESPKDSEPAKARGAPALSEPKPSNSTGGFAQESGLDAKLPQKANRGLTRHRVIIGACLSLSLAAIPLSTIDLKAMVKRPAIVNTSFQIENKRAKPELPPNFTYQSDREFGNPKDSALSEGLIPVFESTWNGNVFGFADESGKVVIKPQFGWVGEFHEGLAPAKTTGEKALAGYIDKAGTWVIKPQFESANRFRDGVAEVALNGNSVGALIDKTGRILVKSKLGTGSIGTGNASIGNLFLCSHKGQMGLVDKTGKWVIPAEYDVIREFEPNYPVNNLPTFHRTVDASKYFLISTNRLWGVADVAGKIIIPPRYEEVLSFQNGHAAVKVDGKYGFVDSAGKTIIEPRYDFVTKFDDLIAVSLNEHWRFIDSSGKLLKLAPVDGIIFDSSGAWLSDGYGVIVVNKLCGYMDREGHIAIPPRFAMATEFKQGYALVWDGLSWRFIDTKGNFVSPSFAEATQFASGKSTVSLAGPLYSFIAAQELESARVSSDDIKKDAAAAKRQDPQDGPDQQVAPDQQGEGD